MLSSFFFPVWLKICVKQNKSRVHENASHKVTFTNSPNIMKNLTCISCFSPRQRTESINPPSISFITCFLLLDHPETPKGKLLVLCWKIVPRKRNYSDWLNPLFFLSIKRATRPTVDERATRAPCVQPSVEAEPCFTANRAFFTAAAPPR